MSNERTKVGLILPSSNTTIEWEFRRYVPQNLSLHTSRIPITSGTTDAIAEMNEELDRCIELLASADVDVVVYGMTTGSLLEGLGHADELEARLRNKLGIPAVATANAVRDALDELGVESVAVTTPYLDELNQREEEFLTASGFEVDAISGLGIASSLEMGDLSPERAAKEATAVDRGENDAVFISCTNWRTFECLPNLEANLGKPVISSNQVTLWATLRAVGESKTPDLGRLFND